MSLKLGKVFGGINLKQTIKVFVPHLKFDEFLSMHFRENDELLAHDAEEKAKPGDWVLIKELDEPLSLKVKHKMLRVVYENGNMIDPITGKKSAGVVFEEDNEQTAALLGIKPFHERFADFNHSTDNNSQTSK